MIGKQHRVFKSISDKKIMNHTIAGIGFERNDKRKIKHRNRKEKYEDNGNTILCFRSFCNYHCYQLLDNFPCYEALLVPSELHKVGFDKFVQVAIEHFKSI